MLKSGLNSDTSSLQGWSVCLWTVLQHLNEKPRKGALSPVNMLTHLAAYPVQLYVQTKEELLMPEYGQQTNILLPATTALSPGDTVEWTWP